MVYYMVCMPELHVLPGAGDWCVPLPRLCRHALRALAPDLPPAGPGSGRPQPAHFPEDAGAGTLRACGRSGAGGQRRALQAPQGRPLPATARGGAGHGQQGNRASQASTAPQRATPRGGRRAQAVDKEASTTRPQEGVHRRAGINLREPWQTPAWGPGGSRCPSAAAPHLQGSRGGRTGLKHAAVGLGVGGAGCGGERR